MNQLQKVLEYLIISLNILYKTILIKINCDHDPKMSINIWTNKMIEVHISNSLKNFYIIFLLIQMGEKLMAGRGVPQNNSQAMQWFRWHLHFQILISEVLLNLFKCSIFVQHHLFFPSTTQWNYPYYLGRHPYFFVLNCFFDNISLNFVLVRLKK